MIKICTRDFHIDGFAIALWYIKKGIISWYSNLFLKFWAMCKVGLALAYPFLPHFSLPSFTQEILNSFLHKSSIHRVFSDATIESKLIWISARIICTSKKENVKITLFIDVFFYSFALPGIFFYTFQCFAIRKLHKKVYFLQENNCYFCNSSSVFLHSNYFTTM